MDPMTIELFIGPLKSICDAAVVSTIEDAVEMFLANPSAYLITIATRMPPRAPSKATASVTRDQP
eukprot:scaffold255562_cov32-Tisochrysis_lutea.AAC.1